MSTYRIKELQNFANNFYNKLYSSEEETSPKKSETIINSKSMRKSLSTVGDKFKNQSTNYKKSLSNYNLNVKFSLKPIKKIKLSNQNRINIYKTLLPWIPPNYEGNYFEKFKRLQDHYDMSNWEKVNIIFINILKI
jgi:hypothetical protein